MQTEAVETTEKEKQVFPLHGLVALFLFLIIYVEYGRRFDAGSGKPYLALPAPLGEGFQMMGLLAAGTVPAVAGLVLLLCSGESRGLLREISAMILLLAACIVWIWIVGKWIQNLTSFTSHMFLLVLINLVEMNVNVPQFLIAGLDITQKLLDSKTEIKESEE